MLGGQVKPMITTCDMRHLYNATPKNETLILQAKEYERRRCNHQDLDEPLSTLECLSSVVDPKDNATNKHRYVVATNDPSTRAKMREIAGVPIIYLSKSIVLMESMADATEQHREREEKSKFKLGLKGQRKPDEAPKRKREDEGNQSIGDQAMGDGKPKTKKRKGPKGPNPLSVKKPKKDTTAQPSATKKARPSTSETGGDKQRGEREESAPRKRRRKHKSKADGGDDAPDGGEPAQPASP
jgi:U3 small nucleolar RNA-associated protein 23